MIFFGPILSVYAQTCLMGIYYCMFKSILGTKYSQKLNENDIGQRKYFPCNPLVTIWLDVSGRGLANLVGPTPKDPGQQMFNLVQ